MKLFPNLQHPEKLEIEAHVSLEFYHRMKCLIMETETWSEEPELSAE